jgi:hypothetical protein
VVRGGQQQVWVVVPEAGPVRGYVGGQVARAVLRPCRGGRASVRVARPPAEVVCLQHMPPQTRQLKDTAIEPFLLYFT